MPTSSRPVFNRGGSVRVDPFVSQGVPYYIHDYYGPGRHAKIVSTKAADLVADGNKYRQEPPLTGDESVVAEVSGVDWPELLEPGRRPAAGDDHHASPPRGRQAGGHAASRTTTARSPP